MTMSAQVMFGSLFLTLCALAHVGVVAMFLPLITRVGAAMAAHHAVLRSTVLLSGAVVAVLVAHTLQIWIWAAVFWGVGAFPEFETSFYFATVTYTTLGYGDLLLGEGLRIFATFGAITGLLTFGISTAFLIAVLGHLMPDRPQGGPHF